MRSIALAGLLLTACQPAATTPDDGPSSDDAAPPDLAPPGCSPTCGGLTPKCNASRHCVGCPTDEDCNPGTFCKVSSDAVAYCVPGCNADARCRMGERCCDMRCVDPMSDVRNCGGCGMACASPHAASTCGAGRCQMGACDPGWG